MESFRRLPEVVKYITDIKRLGHKDIYFIIVGDGSDMENVRKTIEDNKDILKQSVILTGWVPHEEVGSYLKSFDLAIFPFTNDYCSPLKLFEYLGVGLPTIGPDTSAVREVFKDNVHLSLVKQDGSDFIEKFLQLKNDNTLRSRLAQEGKRLVQDAYTWNKNVMRIREKVKSIH